MTFFPYFWLFYVVISMAIFNVSTDEDDLSELMNDEDIRNTWQKKVLELCVHPQPTSGTNALRCIQHKNGLENINVEVLRERPLILKLANFVGDDYLRRIKAFYKNSTFVESQGVEGHAYSKGYRGRRADGLWLEHDEPITRQLFHRLQRTLRINPAIAEEFLILKYEKMGHYAIHYDYLEPMPAYYDDGWYAYYGNRFATALLLVNVAKKGGYTVFPRLNLTVQPQQGDLLLWLNADSNNIRETDSLHAACPIQSGVKMAISLWIRANFQDHLKCAITHPGYDWRHVLRQHHKVEEPTLPENRLKRPEIPKWVLHNKS